MMPYLAPEAPMPMTSWAPRLAEMKARPQTQAGMERPARKKSVLGETVHSFWIAVQTQENMVRNDAAARELQEKDMWSVGSLVHWRKNFQANANANQNLCIGLNVVGQN